MLVESMKGMGMTAQQSAGGRPVGCWSGGLLLMSATVIVALAVTGARAQDVGGTASETAAQSKNGHDPELEEIIVTANKRAENLQNIGAGISVVNDARLDELAANSLEDFIHDIPSINLQSFGAPGYGSIEIRGISPQSVGATVSTYIDDIPLGGSSAVGENASFLPDLDPADIQRVEVLKGPQGTLYGASSLGGVIKYVTKQPSLTQAEATITEEFEHVDHGDYGGKLRASASSPLGDEFAVRVSGYYRWIPGYIDDVGVGGPNVNQGYDWGIRGTVLWKPTSELTVDLNAMEQLTRQNGYSTVDLSAATLQPLYGPLSQLRYTPELFEYRTELYSVEINYAQPYGNFLSASSFNSIQPTLAQDDTPYLLGFPNGSTTIGPDNPLGGDGHHDDRQETEELRFTSNRLGNFEFLAGGFYQHESLNDGVAFVEYEPGGRVPDTSVPSLGGFERGGTLWEAAGFLNATYYIVPSLDVTFGYRYSEIDQHRVSSIYGPIYGEQETDNLNTQQSSNSYLGGARWHITDDVMFYLRAASGYRPGGARSPLPGGPPDFPLYYTSDTIWSYEAGFKTTWLDDKLTLDTDVFWINWDNIQALVTIGAFNTDGNGGHALSRGVEMQATYVPVNGLTLRGNLSYTDAFFKYADASVLVTSPGQRLFYVPELQGAVSADYSWPIANYKGTVGADWSYTGNQYDVSNYLIPSYTLLNARAGLKWHNYTFNFYIKNVADKRAIIGDTGYYPTYYPLYTVTVNQPRTFGLSFSQHF
jgi:iron complex outermembrane recepter protein